MPGFILTSKNQDGYALDHYRPNTDGTIEVAIGSGSTSSPVLAAGSWLVFVDAPCYLSVSPAAGQAAKGKALPIPIAEICGPFDTLPGDYIAVKASTATTGTMTLVPLTEI